MKKQSSNLKMTDKIARWFVVISFLTIVGALFASPMVIGLALFGKAGLLVGGLVTLALCFLIKVDFEIKEINEKR